MCSFDRNCLNDDAPGYKKCFKCKQRGYRERNQLGATYQRLKDHAKERGIKFSLTIEQWRIFCRRTGYLKARGVEAESMTVDRKNPLKGYEIKNIRPLTNSQNTKKQKQDAYFKLKNFRAPIDPDVPF